ncbi:MAG: hypothetical protein GYA24_23750 [Candidatus Lokiarchaeota archaeon]|nr:hypothetical protein [Candidatus Lokiarchaeota archaeon]
MAAAMCWGMGTLASMLLSVFSSYFEFLTILSLIPLIPFVFGAIDLTRRLRKHAWAFGLFSLAISGLPLLMLASFGTNLPDGYIIVSTASLVVNGGLIVYSLYPAARYRLSHPRTPREHPPPARRGETRYCPSCGQPLNPQLRAADNPLYIACAYCTDKVFDV